MKIIVCGGRNYLNKEQLEQEMDWIVKNYYDPRWEIEIIHGGAKGADTLAGEWATSRNYRVKVFNADWKRFGKSAGPIRNERMLQQHPNLVVAFPGGKGTAHMVSIAKRDKLKVIEIFP